MSKNRTPNDQKSTVKNPTSLEYKKDKANTEMQVKDQKHKTNEK